MNESLRTLKPEIDIPHPEDTFGHMENFRAQEGYSNFEGAILLAGEKSYRVSRCYSAERDMPKWMHAGDAKLHRHSKRLEYGPKFDKHTVQVSGDVYTVEIVNGFDEVEDIRVMDDEDLEGFVNDKKRGIRGLSWKLDNEPHTTTITPLDVDPTKDTFVALTDTLEGLGINNFEGVTYQRDGRTVVVEQDTLVWSPVGLSSKPKRVFVTVESQINPDGTTTVKKVNKPVDIAGLQSHLKNASQFEVHVREPISQTSPAAEALAKQTQEKQLKTIILEQSEFRNMSRTAGDEVVESNLETRFRKRGVAERHVERVYRKNGWPRSPNFDPAIGGMTRQYHEMADQVLALKTAIWLLSGSDLIPGKDPDSQRRRIMAQNRYKIAALQTPQATWESSNPPSVEQRRTGAIMAAVQHYGLVSVFDVVTRMQNDFEEKIEALRLTANNNTQGVAWIAEELADQLHFASHPFEKPKDYAGTQFSNPFEQDRDSLLRQRDIIDVQLGKTFIEYISQKKATPKPTGRVDSSGQPTYENAIEYAFNELALKNIQGNIKHHIKLIARMIHEDIAAGKTPKRTDLMALGRSLSRTIAK